jgi:hypothetical protein
MASKFNKELISINDKCPALFDENSYKKASKGVGDGETTYKTENKN